MVSRRLSAPPRFANNGARDYKRRPAAASACIYSRHILSAVVLCGATTTPGQELIGCGRRARIRINYTKRCTPTIYIPRPRFWACSLAKIALDYCFEVAERSAASPAHPPLRPAPPIPNLYLRSTTQPRALPRLPSRCHPLEPAPVSLCHTVPPTPHCPAASRHPRASSGWSNSR